MDSSRYRYGGACGWLLLAGLCLLLLGGIDQATKDALKVGHLLKTIERQTQPSDGSDRSATVTQQELNAYIAYRLAREKQPIISSLTVDLLDGNHVQGKIRFDAAKLHLDVLLGENLDFDFKGIFHTRNRAARLDLTALHLAGYPVKPQVLDFVLGTAGQVYGVEVGRTDDWYELPKGIKRITVHKAKAIVYY